MRKKRVLIIGAGGHGQVVADILIHMSKGGSDIVPIGFVDDREELQGKSIFSLPVLGELDDIFNINHDALIVGIGDNVIRKKIYNKLCQAGEIFISAVHPKAIIGTGVHISEGCVICAGVVINTGTTIGQNVILNTSCSIDHHSTVKAHAHIAPGVHLGGEVVVGEGTLIGIGATILPQKCVGDWSIIGGGSVVTKNIGSKVLAVGVPVRVLKQI